MATQVYPFLLENELTAIFIDTLDAPYFDYLISNLSTYFMDMVTATERWSNNWNREGLGVWKKGLMLYQLTGWKIALARKVWIKIILSLGVPSSFLKPLIKLELVNSYMKTHNRTRKPYHPFLFTLEGDLQKVDKY